MTLNARPTAIVMAFSLALSACADLAPVAPSAPEATPPAAARLECTADVGSLSVDCAGGGVVLAGGARASAVYGGQNSMVRLTSSNVTYDVGTGAFAFDVTVTNLLQQSIGTVDGVNADSAGIKVFFAAGPNVTAGGGVADVANEDGTGDFTGSAQPFFRYTGVLAPGATSAVKRWVLTVPSTATNVKFSVYLSTEAEARLVINEVMANPGGAVQDSTGEYVELYNAGRFPVDLRNFRVADNGGSHTITSSVVVPAGGFALLARTTRPAVNGGLDADYGYGVPSTGTNLTFSNSGADRFVLKAPTGITLDSVAYSNAGTVAKNGVARELKDPSLDNAAVDGANWQDATNVYDVANTNKGTPGAANTNAPTGTPTTPTPTAGAPASVTVSPSSLSLTAGGTRQYSATARDSASQTTTTTFTWTSSDTTVASVTANGFVTARAAGNATITAKAANGVSGSAALQVVASSTGIVFRNHLEFGTPMDADSSNDILLVKREYALSYNAARGGANWISWDLNATHFGGANRCDCFTADNTLPAGVYRVVTSDYTGSGYSRGHMVMSEQRTATPADNTTTFLMTNILPQIQDMNGGPWLQFENYSNTLARTDNKEVYNIAGPVWGTATLNGAGKVTIPTSTWKILVILPYGKGLADVTSASDVQVIAVNMPNVSGIQSQPWTAYRTTVDAIEAATGYDFLRALPDAIEAAVEAN